MVNENIQYREKNKWICTQIGAREHYAIPEALLAAQQLKFLITDYWSKQGIAGISTSFTKNLRGRSHPNIPDANVKSFNIATLQFELLNAISRASGWEKVMRRNEWFQEKAVRYLKLLKEEPTHIFSYSYAAGDIFRYAKSRGWTTVMGQIDPGPLEEEIVLQELQKFPQYQSEWQPAPKAYWENWYEECELADEIVVNSEWSRKALLSKKIPGDKIRNQPLFYTPSFEAQLFNRSYTDKFTNERPLQVLFLGQVILRKGVSRIIAAAESLVHKPIIFTLAGPVGIHPIPNLRNLKVIGRISRSMVSKYYREADVFLFPTLSDGYALTQLEAFAWKLPIITTPFCGEVVEHLHNGYVLANGTSTEIEEILLKILSDPNRLNQWSQNITDFKNVKFEIE